MSDPLSILGAARTIAPIAGKEAKKLRRRSEVQNLVRDSIKTMRADSRIPAAARSGVKKRVKALMADPTALGCMAELLRDGNANAQRELRRRATTLLAAPPGPEWPTEPVVDSFMDAVEDNLVGAKNTERRALEFVMRRLEQRSSGEELPGARPQELTAYGEPTVQVVTSVGSRLLSSSGEVQRWFKDLEHADPALAGEVARRMQDGGVAAVCSWLDSDSVALSRSSVAGVVLLGRIMMASGKFEHAQAVFEHAATVDAEDPARQLARASNAALAQGSRDAADELLKRARGIGGDDHPAVALAEVRRWALEPDDALARLEEITPVGAIEASLLASTRAQALLALDRWDDAEAAASRALELDPGNGIALEMQALVILLRQQDRHRTGEDPDQGALQDSAARFLALREDLIRAERYEESGSMLARAAECHLVRADFAEARRLVGPGVVLGQEVESRAALRLAGVASLANDPRRAIELLADAGTDDEVEYARAEATLALADLDAASRDAALRSLQALLGASDEDVRLRAGLALVIAAAFDREIPRSEEAEAALRAHDPVLADLLRAQTHLAHRELREAEDLFLKHSPDHRALTGLVQVAEVDNDPALALARLDALLDERRTARNLLQRAHLLERVGKPEEASALALELARDGGNPDGLRNDAYRLATRLLQESADPARLSELASEWIDFSDHDPDARWVLAWAQARTGDFAGALSGLDDASVEPTNLQQATFLAGLAARELDVPDALVRLTALSDAFERPEDLEVAVITTAFRRTVPLSPELDARVRSSFEDFPSRFPKSKQIVVLEFPDDPAEIPKFLDRLAPDRSVPTEITRSVLDGDAPLAALAAAVGRTVTELWTQFHALPLGYSNAALNGLDSDDARFSVGRSAIVDPSAVTVLAALPEALRERVISALPGTGIAESGLRDLLAATAPAPETGDAESLSLTRDAATNEPLLLGTDPTEVRDARNRAERALDLARSMPVRLDTDPGSDEELNRLLLDESNDEPRTMRSLLATASIAKRTDAPVWTDDRWLRLALRQMGVRTFGTPALLGALQERGLVTGGEVADCRQVLLSKGALGLRPSSEEVVRLITASSGPSAALAITLGDRHAWRNDASAMGAMLADVLHQCFLNTPRALNWWSAWCLKAVRGSLPQAVMDTVVFSLLATALGLRTSVADADIRFFRSLAQAVRYAGPAVGVYVDPVQLTLLRVFELAGPYGPAFTARLVGRILTMLPLDEQPGAFAEFVR